MPPPRAQGCSCFARTRSLQKRENREVSVTRRARYATLDSPSAPRDVFFVVRGMACATERSSRTLRRSCRSCSDAPARRACRNGAPDSPEVNRAVESILLPPSYLSLVRTLTFSLPLKHAQYYFCEETSTDFLWDSSCAVRFHVAARGGRCTLSGSTTVCNTLLYYSTLLIS